MLPSGRRTVPRPAGETPVPATAWLLVSSGGQTPLHGPRQVALPLGSKLSVYRLRPPDAVGEDSTMPLADTSVRTVGMPTAARPDGAPRRNIPSNAATPSPFIWCRALSRTNLYRGWPKQVTC